MTTYVLDIEVRGHDRASGPLGAVSSALSNIGQIATGTFLGGALLQGINNVTNALGNFIASGLATATDFEKQMSNVQAILGGTAGDLAKLKDLAMQLGIDPKLTISASQAGQMIEILGRNGLNTQQILDGAARATVLLSNATGADYTTAADIATSAMSVFNIRADEMSKAVNGIVGVTNTSKFNIRDYALALAQGGGVASAVGVEFNDFNAAIAAISPLFASGSDAGTAFKTFLTRLVPQSKEAKSMMDSLGLSFFDAKGQLKPMVDVADELENAMAGLTEQQRNNALTTMFGQDAFRVAAALAKTGKDGFLELSDALGKVNAEQSAAVRVDNLAGAMDVLKSSFEGLQLIVGQAPLGFVKDMVLGMATALSEAGPSLANFVTSVGDKLGPMLESLGTLASTVLAAFGIDTSSFTLSTFIDGLSVSVGNVLDWVTNFSNWLSSVLPGAIGTALDFLEYMSAWFSTFFGMIAGGNLTGAMDMLGEQLGRIGEFVSNALNQAIVYVQENLPGWIAQLQVWGNEAWAWIQRALPPLLERLGEWASKTIAYVVGKLPEWIATLLDWSIQAWQWVADAVPKLILQLGEFLGKVMRWATSEVLPALIENGLKFAAALIDWIANELLPKVEPKFNEAKEAMMTAIGKIVIAAVAAMNEMATNMIDGLTEGIRDNAQSITNALGGVIDAAIQAIKDRLLMHSPSQVFADMGANMMLGMAAGILDAANAPREALTDALAPLTGGGEFAFAGAPGMASGGPRTVNNYYLSANYAYQDERRLRDDIVMLQMLTAEA